MRTLYTSIPHVDPLPHFVAPLTSGTVRAHPPILSAELSQHSSACFLFYETLSDIDGYLGV